MCADNPNQKKRDEAEKNMLHEEVWEIVRMRNGIPDTKSIALAFERIIPKKCDNLPESCKPSCACQSELADLFMILDCLKRDFLLFLNSTQRNNKTRHLDNFKRKINLFLFPKINETIRCLNGQRSEGNK